MSVDEAARVKARRARASGDAVDADAAGRAEARAGGGIGGFLLPLVGTWVYIEGARMNYRGVLADLFLGHDGQPTGLVMDPCIRVGDWSDQPNASYEERMHGPHLVTWGSVIEIGPQMKAWPQK